jgi:dTDP-4-amino-4,6-dideoxygalactose transaminase
MIPVPDVPLFDLMAQHASIRGELDEAIAGVIDGGHFVGGEEVGEFEGEFAAYCGTRHCVGASSGTDALALALQAAGIGSGHEVITTPLTFIATAESILLAGAKPVFVDPEPDTALLDPASVEEAIGEDTAAIVVVHLYGHPVDMDAFRELADRRKLLLVEDAAQAHGAAWDGRPVGSLGDLAAFSFYPGKNLGALGDGGAVTTDDAEIASTVAALRDHGRSGKHRHDRLGTNARLDTLQAAVLRVKLRHLDEWNELRRQHAASYDRALADVDGIDPIRLLPKATSAYHQYVVTLKGRDDAAAHLEARGIATGLHYPVPIHRQPALAGLAGERALPNAERLAQRVLSLPISPELTPEQLESVIEALREHSRN